MSPEFNHCAPTDSCLLGHCRRVAAVAQCIAHQLFLAAPVKVSVESAALLHHSPVETFPRAIDGEALVPALLRAFHHAADAPKHLRRLAEIIHIANRFDELYELRATEPRSPAEIVAELRRLAEENSWSMGPVHALEKVVRETDVKGFTAGQIARIAAADPLVAGNLAQAANSALCMGYQALFTRPSMRPLLRHALEAAELAHRLAARTPAIDREEAFLCGLLHDAGKLLIDRLNLFDSARMRGLLDHGCPPVYAENLLLGCDHGEAGADIAAYWRLPARHAEAIRYHHQPEGTNSTLAHLLYLVEWRLGHLEDMPSAERVVLCMGSTGVTAHSLEAWHDGRLPVALVA